MKYSKSLIVLVLVGILSSLILAGCYNLFNGFAQHARASESTPELPQLQILSPQENGTYQAVNVPINITANAPISKITYSLDGAENVTYQNVTAPPSLTKGVHNLAVYAFDDQGKVGASKNITFNIDLPYPPSLKLTMREVQETINYLENRGLKVQVLDTSKPQNNLYAEAVYVESKEDLANYAIAKGINVIYEVLELNVNYVAFCANYYDNSPLPIAYTYSATLYSTS